MKSSVTHPFIFRLLIIANAFFLAYTAVVLCWAMALLYRDPVGDQSSLAWIGYAIVTGIYAAIIIVALTYAFLMPSYFWRPKRLEKMGFVHTLYRRLDKIAHAPNAERQNYLTVWAMGILTIYLFFFQEQSWIFMLWNFLLPFSLFLLRRPLIKIDNFTPPVIGLLILLGFGILRMNADDIILLDKNRSYLIAVLVALLTFVPMVVRFYLKWPLKVVSTDPAATLLFLIVVSGLGFFSILAYYQPMVKAINCQFDKRQRTAYRAKVAYVFTSYPGYTQQLLLSYDQDNKILVNLSKPQFGQYQQGDTISLFIHPGVFHIPWYHEVLEADEH